MRFSEEEINDLIKAWIAIAFAFAIARSGLRFMTPQVIIDSAVIVGIAFILHELGHKFMAQRYGLWAEFRADDMMLILSLLLSFTGIVFAAPGAVVILGVSNFETYGKTAVAGPIVNILLALLFFTLLQVPLPAGLPLLKIIPLFHLGFSINAWLAFFNLIPFGPLDGFKVMNWNRTFWAFLFVFSAILSFVI